MIVGVNTKYSINRSFKQHNTQHQKSSFQPKKVRKKLRSETRF